MVQDQLLGCRKNVLPQTQTAEKSGAAKMPESNVSKKNEKWYGCKETCVPGGPDPIDANNETWNCTSVGMRTPGPYRGGKEAPWVQKWCSSKSENCFHTKCCKDAGHQCFKKTAGWAMCMPACMHGPLLKDA